MLRSTSPVRWILIASASLPLVLGGCGGSATVAAAAGLPPGEVQAGLQRVTALDQSYRVVFQWEYQEPGARFRGEGVARLEPPYRGRLDLFTASGDRVAAAVLTGDHLTVLEGMPVVVPPAMMLWGALGVLHPTAGFRASEARRIADAEIELHYRGAGAESMVLRVSDNRIQRLDRLGDGRREELRLEFLSPEARFPREALYRDLVAVRELRLRIESEESVETYPAHVWMPDA
jgi:hypothetical protein